MLSLSGVSSASTWVIRNGMLCVLARLSTYGDRTSSLVKPDIVFFGEQLPARFFEKAMVDFPKADLLIVMGTSLVVQPFAGLVNNAPPAATRLLVNRERVGEDSFGFGGRGFDFDAEGSRDLFHQGDCDGFVADLVERLGWGAEFERI